MNKPEITNKKLEELKQKAESATQGIWQVDADSRHIRIIKDDGFATYPFRITPTPNEKNNAAYVAAASPDFILALIEDDMQLLRENRRFSNEIAQLNKMVEWFADRMPSSRRFDNRQERIDHWKEIARREVRYGQD